jgi:hypothetical protein
MGVCECLEDSEKRAQVYLWVVLDFAELGENGPDGRICVLDAGTDCDQGFRVFVLAIVEHFEVLRDQGELLCQLLFQLLQGFAFTDESLYCLSNTSFELVHFLVENGTTHIHAAQVVESGIKTSLETGLKTCLKIAELLLQRRIDRRFKRIRALVRFDPDDGCCKLDISIRSAMCDLGLCALGKTARLESSSGTQQVDRKLPASSIKSNRRHIHRRILVKMVQPARRAISQVLGLILEIIRVQRVIVCGLGRISQSERLLTGRGSVKHVIYRTDVLMFGEIEDMGEEVDESGAGPFVQKTQQNRKSNHDPGVDAQHADG